MGKFWADFKTFISKGNVLDLAVGVVVGGAFGKITSSLVADIIMPLISLVAGGVNVSEWKIVLKEAVLDAEGAVTAAEVAVRYGNFIQMILDFLIIALSIFAVLRVSSNPGNPDYFDYFSHPVFESDQDFNAYISRLKRLSLHPVDLQTDPFVQISATASISTKGEDSVMA